MIVRCIITVALFTLIACRSQLSQEPPTRATAVGTEVKSITDWSFRGTEGKLLMSEAWNIHTTIEYEHIVEMLPDFYAALIERYMTSFGELPFPKKPLEVFLFSDESQWQKKLEEMLGRDARQWFKLGRGGVTIDGTAVLYYLDRRGRSRATLRIAAHEGWHQYAESIFRVCLPTWLDEGIGTWMEGFRIRNGEVEFFPNRNWDRLTVLRKIVAADRLTSLDELLKMRPSELLETNRTSLLGYYAQLWAFISFIMEFDDGMYRPALRQMLQDAQNGVLVRPRAKGGWLRLLTDDPVQMEQSYKEWVVDYSRPGSTWR